MEIAHRRWRSTLWHARRSSAQETTTRPTPRTTLFRAVNGAMVKRYGERIIRLQRQGTSMDVNFQVADVHRPIIASQGLDGDGLRSRILQEWRAHIRLGDAAGRWKTDAKSSFWHLTHSVTWLIHENAPLEVPLLHTTIRMKIQLKN